MRTRTLLLHLMLWSAAHAAASTIPMKLVNNSTFADSEIYVAIIGQYNGQTIYYNLADNRPDHVSLPRLTTAVNTLHRQSGDWGYANVFTTLDRIPDQTIHIEHTNACRVFIGFRSPMYLHAFDGNGGYAGADLQNPSDPNSDIRWELVEFTYDNNNVMFVNTTRVDAFQYPMGVELYGTATSNNAYMKRGETLDYQTIVQRWQSTYRGTQFGPCYVDHIDRDDLGGIIMQPSKVAAVKQNGYFDDYIDRIWSRYRTHELYADMGQLGQWRGGVTGDVFTMRRVSDGAVARIHSKPTTTHAIEGAGAFATGNSLDLALQAMFCGAVNRGVIDLSVPSGQLQRWGDVSKFYRTDVCNEYVRFFHQPDLSHDTYTYAFAYDDTFDQSSTCATSNPDRVVVTIGGFAGKPSGGQTQGGQTPGGTQPPVADAAEGDYRLVWSDEFDDNTLGANWNAEVTGSPANNELQYYTARPTNVDVRDGNLVLTARRENYGGRAFTSGRVNSQGKVSFTHGKIEARIKMPRTARGLWPAFWLMGDDIPQVGWPKCGEIDIMEAGNAGGYGGNEERHFSGALHWGERWDQHQYWAPGAVTSSYDVTGDYHLFTCTWDEQFIHCYLDDQTQPYFSASIGEGFTSSPYTHKPYHILFNLAVGGDFPAIYDAAGISALPAAGQEARMYVDYVRVYQKEANVRAARNDVGQQAPAVAPAPEPTRGAEDVRSLYGEHYAQADATAFFDTWGSAGESLEEVTLAPGNKAQRVDRFGYVGFNFSGAYRAIDMSDMEYLHLDIYASKDMPGVVITPITQGPQETDQIRRDLRGGQWNSLDLRLSDFRDRNAAMDYARAFQVKVAGGDQTGTLYIDNINFYRQPTAQHITMEQGVEVFSADRDLDFTGVQGLQPYIVSGYVKSPTPVVVITPVSQVPAGTGVLLYGTQGTSYRVPYGGHKAVYANLLQATVAETTVEASTADRVNMMFDGQSFVAISGSARCGAHKAYLQLPADILASGARSIRWVIDGEAADGGAATTGIDTLGARPQDEAYYTLEGVRVRQPLRRGIYIHRGRKVIVR